MERDVVTKSFDAISWTCMFIVVVVVKLIYFDFYKEERKIIATNSIWFQRYNTCMFLCLMKLLKKTHLLIHLVV